VRHEHGKGNITNRLRRLEAGTGLIDEDSAGYQPRELRNYREVKRTGKLILLEHADSSEKRLVLVCPRLEEWLFTRAAAHWFRFRRRSKAKAKILSVHWFRPKAVLAGSGFSLSKAISETVS
jgi:hypothetical protein